MTATQAPETVAMSDDAIAVFRCPQCGGTLRHYDADKLSCSSCGHSVAAVDGIIDFVAGASATSLDDIDYDAFYGIDADHSLGLLQGLQRVAGPLWPTEFGDTVEIGCGTGGASLALFGHMAVKKAVLTDVSPKMLRICRERLVQALGDRARAFTFATYGGTENCFQEEAFDCCFGTAVVHHIADVPQFLRQVQTLLKPGGFAFFMEPSHIFHRALTRALAEIIAELLRRKTLPTEEISRMLNWVAEVHCNIVNTGDIAVLSEREDKHFFQRAAFLDSALQAGFGEALACPCDPDPTGLETIRGYLLQCGVSAEGIQTLAAMWASASARHFWGLASNDQSPSYLFWLRNSGQQAPRSEVSAKPSASSPSRSLPVIFWLKIRASRTSQGLEINLAGWCVADIPIASVEFRVGDEGHRFPIWMPRADIELSVNAQRDYPSLHALCSGFEGSFTCKRVGMSDASVDVIPEIVCVGGKRIDAGTIALTIDADTDRVIHTEIAP